MTESSPAQTPPSRFKAVLRVVFIICVAVIIGITARPLIRSWNHQKNSSGSTGTATTKTSASSTSRFISYHVAGLKIELPGPPMATSLEIPQQIKTVTEKFEVYNIKDGSNSISILHAVYKLPEANLNSSAEATINELKSQPNNVSFKSSMKPATFAGLEGWEITMSYVNTGYPLSHICAAFGQKNELWQIQIIGLSTSEKSSLQMLKERIFNSITITPPPAP